MQFRCPGCGKIITTKKRERLYCIVCTIKKAKEDKKK